MKILVTTNHSYMLLQYRRELIKELLKENELICVMPFTGRMDEFQEMGIRCIEIKIDRRGINPVKDAGLIYEYYKIIKKEKPDLVLTYSIKPNIYAGTVSRFLKIPYCAHVQGVGSAFENKFIAKIATTLYRFALKKVRTVFFENEGNAELFRNLGIVSREKQTILHGAGVNLEYHSYKTYPQNEKIHFAYLGRIMKEKGMDELFEVTKRLHEEGYQFVVELAGFFEDEYKERVESMEKLGVVKYHGFVDDPRFIYENVDCIVLPSYHEGMSNVLLEGAATGRALITSNIPGCREAVDNNVNGLLCEPKNADSLYYAMKEYLSYTFEERVQMGKQGRIKMANDFDKKSVVSATMNALKLN